ncbi:MAG TPA: DUF4381 domain-containing protein [Rhodanobacteraceae bacterium]|nr:DUF4381 domain-containing protein [Rhodanobacteraceae bacterium]
MNAAGPILRDIHVAPAGWWPPAPGWWLLAALAVLAVAGVWLAVRWRARRGPLRTALQELDALAQTYAREGDVAGVLDQASRLVRRIARRIDPAVTSQTGEAWRAFVRRHAGRGQDAVVLDALLEPRFRRAPDVDMDALLVALRKWCRAALRHPGARTPPAWSEVRST